METSNLQELKDAAIELIKFTCNSCERRFCEDDVEEEDGQRVPSPCSRGGEGTEDCQLRWAQMPYEVEEGGAK